MKTKTGPILLAFFVMGVADAMGPLSEAVRKNYQLSSTVSTLLSFFVFIAFAVFSVPGGLLAGKIGKKNLLLLGLALNAAAMLIPCLWEPGFVFLLGCIFVLGIGTTFLQVAGNPIMRDVSAPGRYSRNLSLAQGFKGVGSTVSSYLVTAVSGIILFNQMGWRAVFPIFFILMVITFVWTATLKVSETKAEVPPSIHSSLALLGKPVFALAVLGIFLYVGAEACLGRFLLPLLEEMGVRQELASKFGPAFFFLMLTAGRLLGPVVLHWITPRMFFTISAVLGLLGGAILMFGNGLLGPLGVLAAGLGYANIWPMLFSITVEEDPKHSSELSGLMCMAIAGGAVIPLLMGKLVDLGWGKSAFLVPVVCFLYLFVLSLRKETKKGMISPEKA